MSGMDGSHRKVLIDNNLYQPYGIVVDQKSKTLFWCDTNNEGATYKIERSDLNGLNRKTVIEGVDQKPFAISIAQDRIYWTDARQHMLMSLPANTIGGEEGVRITKFEKIVHGMTSSALHLNADVRECTALAPFIKRVSF